MTGSQIVLKSLDQLIMGIFATLVLWEFFARLMLGLDG